EPLPGPGEALAERREIGGELLMPGDLGRNVPAPGGVRGIAAGGDLRCDRSAQSCLERRLSRCGTVADRIAHPALRATLTARGQATKALVRAPLGRSLLGHRPKHVVPDRHRDAEARRVVLEVV